jgi:hypothetical protein
MFGIETVRDFFTKRYLQSTVENLLSHVAIFLAAAELDPALINSIISDWKKAAPLILIYIIKQLLSYKKIQATVVK